MLDVIIIGSGPYGISLAAHADHFINRINESMLLNKMTSDPKINRAPF